MGEEVSTDPKRSIGELVIFLGAVVIDQWVLRNYSDVMYELPAFGAAALVLIMSIRRRGGLKHVLSNPDGSACRSWLAAMLTTALLASLLILWGLFIREPYDELPLKITCGGLVGLSALSAQHLVWAILQQGLLQLFLRPVIGEIFKKAIFATGATAVVFGLLHLPSLVLACATMLLGAVWITLFSRYRRMGPVIVSHAVLSAAAFIALPPQWSYELNVGVVALKLRPEYQALGMPETRRVLNQVTSEAYFEASGGTDQDFIKSLYWDMLSRTPADAEVQHWLDRMKKDHSRYRVATAFARSREFRARISKRTGAEKGSP